MRQEHGGAGVWGCYETGTYGGSGGYGCGNMRQEHWGARGWGCGSMR